MESLDAEDQSPLVLATRWAVVTVLVARLSVLVELAGAGRTGGLPLTGPDDDAGLRASLRVAAELAGHRFPHRPVSVGWPNESVGDLVKEGVEDVGFRVPVGVEGVQGDDPPPRATGAESMCVVAKLHPPATKGKAVQLEQLTSGRSELAPVHDDQGCFIGKVNQEGRRTGCLPQIDLSRYLLYRVFCVRNISPKRKFRAVPTLWCHRPFPTIRVPVPTPCVFLGKICSINGFMKQVDKVLRVNVIGRFYKAFVLQVVGRRCVQLHFQCLHCVFQHTNSADAEYRPFSPTLF